MKLRDLPIAGGAAAATIGSALALASTAALPRALGIPLGIAAAALAGGLGGRLSVRAAERRLIARLATLDPDGEDRPEAAPPPTGWTALDGTLATLGEALGRLGRDRAELEEFERLTRAFVATAHDGPPDEAEALDARQCLQDMLNEFGQAAALVVQAAETLDEATKRMASGAAEQAGAIARTTTTVESLSDDIDLISRNAEAASEACEHARDEARRGLDQVHEAVEGMDRLRAHVEANGRKVRRLGDRSVEIGTITDMIKGISQRTDMLALNATIESVRAGEHGRGFAVVAEEIRKLAERAAIATREIGTLVESIQGDTHDSIRALSEEQAEVELEAERVREAGAALERIGEFAELSARLVERISHSTDAQVRATQDLVCDAQQISEVAQQTLDGAARAREYVRKLSQRCARLQRLASPDAVPPAGQGSDDGLTPVKTLVTRPRLAAIGRTS